MVDFKKVLRKKNVISHEFFFVFDFIVENKKEK